LRDEEIISKSQEFKALKLASKKFTILLAGVLALSKHDP